MCFYSFLLLTSLKDESIFIAITMTLHLGFTIYINIFQHTHSKHIYAFNILYHIDIIYDNSTKEGERMEYIAVKLTCFTRI